MPNKRYPDCINQSGGCSACSLSSYGRDCRNNPVNPIAYRRAVLGLTQSQVAERTGCTVRYVQKIESGTILLDNITLRNAARLAAALELTLDELAKYMA